MRQALHIVRKDIRYLRGEICLLAALAALFAFVAAHANTAWWMEMLLLIAAGYVVARAVHAEPIPGDRQFWITRPYRWTSLVAAKVLFIVLFVNMPILLARLAVILIDGFPLGATLPGLLWSQLLLLLCILLPMATLAALTSGLVPLIFSALILLAVGFGVAQAAWPSPRWLSFVSTWPVGVEWVRESIAVLVLTAIAACILYMQYRHRQTPLSRMLAIAGVVLGGVLYFGAPLSIALSVQSAFSKTPVDPGSFRVVLDPGMHLSLNQAGRTNQVQITVPLAIEGVPAGVNLRPDAFVGTMRASDGRTWTSEGGGVNIKATRPGVATYDAVILADSSLFKTDVDQPLSIHGTLFLTIFGNPQTSTVPLRTTPVNVMDNVQCRVGEFRYVFCRSAFRWPARLLYVQVGPSLNPLTSMISYSPFPANVYLDPIETHWASGPRPDAQQLTIIAKEPLAHFRRNFDLNGIRPREIAGAAALK